MREEDTRSKALKQFFIALSEQKESATEDDKIFRTNTKEQIIKRDEQYTRLLLHFVMVTKVRNWLKEFFKWTFYIVIVWSLLVLGRIVYAMFRKYLIEAGINQLIESIPLLLSSLVGFVSAIITIPIAITKYLFSTKEDEHITNIILHTQEHDVNGRKWTMDFKKLMESNENNSDE